MKTVMTLVKREWWEVRNSFLYSPMAIGLLLVLVAVGGLFFALFANTHIDWSPGDIATQNISVMVYSIGFIFALVLWLTVLNYFWNCLYYDRKDGSVLFWQSMPVSQCQTITAKLIAGLLVAPIVAWICLVITEAIVLLLSGISLSILHLPGWDVLWQPGQIVVSWLTLLATFLIQGIWLFPIIGWLVFCSAYAKRTPFLMAIVPPVVVIIIESLVLKHSYLFHFIAARYAYMANTWRYFMGGMNEGASKGMFFIHGQSVGVTKVLMPPSMGLDISTAHYIVAALIGVGVGLVFVVIAAALRSRCYGFER